MRVYGKRSIIILVLLLSLPWQVAQAQEIVSAKLGTNQIPTTFIVGGAVTAPTFANRQHQPMPIPTRVAAVTPTQVKQAKLVQRKLKPAVVKSIPPYWFRVVEPAKVVAVEREQPAITHLEQPILPKPTQPTAQRQWWGAAMAPKVPGKFVGTIPATRHPSARVDEVVTNVPPAKIHKPVSSGKNCYCPCAKQPSNTAKQVTRLPSAGNHSGAARFIVR